MSLEQIVIEPKQKPNACVIWLHGLGADGHDFESMPALLQLPNNIQARFILPHAPIRPVTMNGGMPCRSWFDIHSPSIVEETLVDEQELEQSQQRITGIIEAQSKEIDTRRIILAGFSQGGTTALFTGLQYPKPLAGLIGLSTYLSDLNSLTLPNLNIKPPIFLAHGQYDAVIPFELAKRTRQHLEEAHYSVSWHEYPMAHEFCMEEAADLRAWMINVLQP